MNGAQPLRFTAIPMTGRPVRALNEPSCLLKAFQLGPWSPILIPHVPEGRTENSPGWSELAAASERNPGKWAIIAPRPEGPDESANV
jgi:hypothetical protein